MKDEDAQPNIFGYDGSFAFSAGFWGLAVATGIGAGLAAAGLMLLLRAIQHAAWNYSSGDFLQAVEKASATRRLIVILSAGVLVAVARIVLRRRTGGHGGELAEAIWFRAGEMPFWHTMARGIVSIWAVALGAAVGRESAPKQAGGAIGNLLAKWGRLSSPQRRVLVACGAGAGMAAVYNVPLGGALFALEVLLGELTLSLVLPAVVISLTAVVVSWLFLPDAPTYSIAIYPFSPAGLAGAGVLGIFAGLASIFWVKGVAWADARKPRRNLTAVVIPLLVFAALAGASILFPQLPGNGKGLVQLTFAGELGWPLLAALLLARAVATIACLGSGTPGGLFTPTLTVGAVLGGLFGSFWNRFLPREAMAVYAIFGAAAVLAASTKGPISALVLIFELTHHMMALAVPAMLVVAAATVVAKHFDPRSLYSARIHRGAMAAKQTHNPQVISASMRYPEIVKHLLALSGRALYVTDERGVFIGAIDRARALRPELIDGPLETTGAADLAAPVKALPSTLPPEEMAERARAGGAPEMPIIDTATGKLTGIFHDGKFTNLTAK